MKKRLDKRQEITSNQNNNIIQLCSRRLWTRRKPREPIKNSKVQESLKTILFISCALSTWFLYPSGFSWVLLMILMFFGLSLNVWWGASALYLSSLSSVNAAWAFVCNFLSCPFTPIGMFPDILWSSDHGLSRYNVPVIESEQHHLQSWRTDMNLQDVGVLVRWFYLHNLHRKHAENLTCGQNVHYWTSLGRGVLPWQPLARWPVQNELSEMSVNAGWSSALST